MQLPPKTVYVPVTLIRDGELLHDELVEIGKNSDWLKKELKNQGVDKFRDVFLAEWLEGEGLFVQAIKQVSGG